MNNPLMRFFTGIFNVADVHHFGRAFVSVHRLATRKGDFAAGEWIMDSGAFSTILKHGGYPEPVEAYARQIHRWKRCGTLLAAVAQDYMCEAPMLAKTGLSIADHQRMTIERYDALRALVDDVYIMPVLQGWTPSDYLRHLAAYGDRLAPGAWVGVGSVCKRNSSNPMSVFMVLSAIKSARPDLRLHGFGLKITSLKSPYIRELLDTADSMAWSYAGRREQGKSSHWSIAAEYTQRVEEILSRGDGDLFGGAA